MVTKKEEEEKKEWQKQCTFGGEQIFTVLVVTRLRVGLGQNGQILFISVEQLSLNVAGDSAKRV